jgi:hypothetical protein
MGVVLMGYLQGDEINDIIKEMEALPKSSKLRQVLSQLLSLSIYNWASEALIESDNFFSGWRWSCAAKGS